MQQKGSKECGMNTYLNCDVIYCFVKESEEETKHKKQ